MGIWGKIVGGAAGFALGGPLGGLIGAAFGHAVDWAATGDDPGEPPDNTRKAAFTIAVIALSAKMAKADGTVTDSEVRAFREVFRVAPEELPNVTRVFNIARRDHRNFESYARQVAGMFRDRRPVLEELLECLFHIARADSIIHPEELDYLRRVARIFGFTDAEFERMRQAGLGPDAGDPYHILGIDRDADDDAVKLAWRRLIRETHPDRLIGEGLPREFIDVATARMATINAAYDRICRDRGLR